MTRSGLRSSIGYNQLAGIKAQLQSSSIMRIVSMTQHGAMHYNFFVCPTCGCWLLSTAAVIRWHRKPYLCFLPHPKVTSGIARMSIPRYLLVSAFRVVQLHFMYPIQVSLSIDAKVVYSKQIDLLPDQVGCKMKPKSWSETYKEQTSLMPIGLLNKLHTN